MSDDDKKPRTKYHLEQHGRQTRVVESSTELIIRTLDTRAEAVEFVSALDPRPKEKK